MSRKPIRHKTRESLQRCPQCGAWAASLSNVSHGCALYHDMKDEALGAMCKEMRNQLLTTALRRAVIPDAFDERMRMKPGRLADVLDAERDAIRKAAALLGPVDLDSTAGQS